ncbi:MAG: PilZ domain-containing protein [Deltaproteobacteria bacterium]|nr:PilZ domain-containing protein [Deltaproteobacteria bacterium]
MADGLLLADKRELIRRELIYYLKVTDLLNSQEIGRMVDIHAKGLLLMGSTALTIGHDYVISLELPKALRERGAANIVVKARSVWCRPSQTQPYLENGLMFIDPSQETEAAIENLIQIFAMPSGTMSF